MNQMHTQRQMLCGHNFVYSLHTYPGCTHGPGRFFGQKVQTCYMWAYRRYFGMGVITGKYGTQLKKIDGWNDFWFVTSMCADVWLCLSHSGMCHGSFNLVQSQSGVCC